MTEKISNSPVYYTKDFNDWGGDQDNFVTNQELTVTITLNEYRDLIQDSAKNKAEINELEAKLKVLKTQNSDLILRLKGDKDGDEHE